MSPELILDAASRTHTGLVRKRNEDSIYQGEWLYAVADGLGGHVAGDVASATAIEILKPKDQLVDPANLAAVLGEAISAIGKSMRRKVQEDPELSGMGTTLVAMLRSGHAAVLANIGDSRAYLLRNSHLGGETIQISEDHTYQYLVADSANVPNLPERLARFLDGRIDGRSPDLTLLDLRPGDRILLCSDGLSSYVPHDLIHAALSAPIAPDKVAERLIDLAVGQGGIDNVSVVVIDVALRRD